MAIRKYCFTSDTHLSHRNIIKYSSRPFKDEEEMNEAIIENWNSVVGPSDVVYHLGDVAFEKDRAKLEHMLSRLNGEKHIVWGNHDNVLKSIEWKKYFKTSADLRKIHVPAESNNGVAQSIVLCHYAMRVWDQSHYGCFHLHGHSHGTLPDDPNALSLDVGTDCWDYKPVTMEQLTERMKQKTWRPVDHHRSHHKDSSEVKSFNQKS